MPLCSDGAYALDPVRFATKAGIVPDDWQANVLFSAAPRLLLNCSRQVGKSTIVGVLASHVAIYEPGSLTLVVSPSQRQSSLLFQRVQAVYRALGRPVPAEAENKLSLELENGSRIVSLPGKEATIRGFSGVSLLVIDEASRVPDDLYHAVTPMLAVSGGRLALLSTPFGTRGFFYEAWRDRAHGWDYYEVPATACPRITRAFLAEQKRTIGDWWFEQEYECRFLDSQSAVFRQEDIDQMKESYEPWDLKKYMSA